MATRRKFTEKELRRFAEQYVIFDNGYKAATAAFPDRYKNKNSAVKAAVKLKKLAAKIIKELQDERAERVQITADDVLRDIAEIKRRCMQAQPILDKEGNQTGEWKFEPAAALKACELEGKHLGMWENRLRVEGDGFKVIIQDYTSDA